MLRLSVRTLLSHKLRSAMTALAVVVGVGFVVGSFVVTDTLRRAVDDLFETITTVDVSVRAEPVLQTGGGGPASTGRIPADLEQAVAAVDGVAAAEGQVTGYVQLVDLDGEPVTSNGAPFFGFRWNRDPRLNPAELVAGRAPERPGEVAVDRGQAQDFGFEPGDRTEMLVADGRVDVEIAGIFTYGETNSLLGARVTAMESGWASEVLDAQDEVDTIDVVAEPGVRAEDLVGRIQPVLPEGVEAVPSEQVVEEGEDQVSGIFTLFRSVLLVFAGIAVFVAAFYINNTFAVLMRQRVRELSLLRAVGATGRQVVTSVALEAVVIGVVAGVIGVGFGLLIAMALEELLSAGGFDLPDRALVLRPRTLAAAFVVGLPITVVSALPPARRASRVSPVEGLRTGQVRPALSHRRRLVTGAVVTAAGVGFVVAGLFVLDDTVPRFVSLGIGAVGVFLGVATLSPLVAGPVSAVLGWPVARLGGATGRLARANALRNPFRTARTAAALMVGLALVTMAFVVGESLKRSFADAVEGVVAADYIASSGGITGFSPAVADDLRARPEIDAVTAVRADRLAVEGSEADVLAVDPKALGQVLDLDLQAGSIDELGPGSILVHEDSAQKRELEVGDTVEVAYASGDPREVSVAGVYADARFVGNYVMDYDTFVEAYPTNDTDLFVFATVEEGIDPEAVKADVATALVDHPQVELQSRSEFNQSLQEQFDQILVAVNGLLALALFIALLGIGNTLALSVVERTREIGLLRAVGLTGRQTRSMVMLEALIVALFGTVLGVVLGVVFGLGASAAMPASVITTIAVPVGSLAVVIVAAAVLGIVAGLLPARRAARLDVLRAIGTE